MSHRTVIVAVALLLFATVCVKGVQVASALMPFEGWDEYQHVAVADFLGREGRLPTQRDRVHPELWPFLRAHPHPADGARQLWGLGARTYADRVWSGEAWVGAADVAVRDEPPLLYEAQQGPVYYRLLVALKRVLGLHDPLVWVDAARLVNVVLTACTVAAWFVLLTLAWGEGPTPGVGHAGATLLPVAVCTAVATHPLFLFNGARVANDAPAILLATLTLLLWVAAVRRPDVAAGWRPFVLGGGLGLLTGLTVTTKAIGVALLPVLVVALPCVLRARGRSLAACAGAVGLFLAGYLALAGPYHLQHFSAHGTLTGMQEAIWNRAEGRSVGEIAGEIPGIVLHTVRRTYVLDQFHVGGWSFLDGTGGLRRVHRWLFPAGLLLGLVALARRTSRRRLVDLVRARPEPFLLLVALWAALLHHAFQTRLALGHVGTNPWYTALVLPVLVLVVLAGPWALWRPAGPLLALSLAVVWSAAHARAMLGTLIPFQAGTRDLAEGLARLATHHAFLHAAGRGMLAAGVVLTAATIAVALAGVRFERSRSADLAGLPQARPPAQAVGREVARTTPRRRRLAAVLVALAGGFLLVESGLRVAGCRYRAAYWDAFAEQQPPDDWATVLALGESTTAGLWVPREESYPMQLEGLLRAHYGTDRIRVLIPPHIGQNTSQMLHRFPQYLAASRPAVVIFMAGVNNGWSLAESNLGEFMPQGDWRTHAFRLRRLLDDVKVFRLARAAFAERGAVQGDLAGRPRFTQWPPPGDPLVRGIGEEPFLRLWRSDVGRMIDLAQESGVAVILMTYPNYDTPPAAEFRELARLRAVPLVDNHVTFQPHIEQGRAAELFFEDLRHPNARGYAIVADGAFHAVVTSGVLERRLRGIGGEPPPVVPREP